MTGGIYLIQDDGQLVEMKEQSYDSESVLQQLLAKYPNLLAGDQMNSIEPRRWLLISTEVGLPSEEAGADRWSIDNLYLDQDAIPTIVEVKRSTDTRIRREVVGQMLDYAANAVAYWPIETISSKFEARCQEQGENPEQVLQTFLGSDITQEEFWQKAKINLQACKLRLVFVADEIPPELRRIVEFLNNQMDPVEVLAVDIRQYVGKGLKALVPRVIGETQKRSGGKRESRQWDESSFFHQLATERDAEEVEIVRRILDWAKDRMPRIWWGKGAKWGSFIPVLDFQETHYTLIQVGTSGYITLQFQLLQSKTPFDSESKRLELLQRFNKINGISLSEDAINRYPSVFLSTLKDEPSLSKFIETLDWFIEAIKSP